jgi:DNA-binding NtrC family response regulator
MNEHSGQGREVVLVDDDEGFVETLGALLRSEGYSVVAEPTVSGALDYLASHTPDVLITDIRLGEQNGWTLAKHVTRNRPDVRVIIVTGMADQFEGELEYWTLPLFLKPFDADQLLDHLREPGPTC